MPQKYQKPTYTIQSTGHFWLHGLRSKQKLGHLADQLKAGKLARNMSWHHNMCQFGYLRITEKALWSFWWLSDGCINVPSIKVHKYNTYNIPVFHFHHTPTLLSFHTSIPFLSPACSTHELLGESFIVEGKFFFHFTKSDCSMGFTSKNHRPSALLELMWIHPPWRKVGQAKCLEEAKAPCLATRRLKAKGVSSLFGFLRQGGKIPKILVEGFHGTQRFASFGAGERWSVYVC